MACGTCGCDVQPGANFCSHCGRVLGSYVDGAAGMPHPSRLIRPRSGRMIAGVCAGIAQQYGWDVSAVRIASLLLILFTGVGLLVYLAAWIVIPNASLALPAGRQFTPQTTGTMGQ